MTDGPLMLRIWGCFAPEGTPEREYFTASVRHGTDSAEFRAAAKRLDREGCPPFPATHRAEWRDGAWIVERRGDHD